MINAEEQGEGGCRLYIWKWVWETNAWIDEVVIRTTTTAVHSWAFPGKGENSMRYHYYRYLSFFTIVQECWTPIHLVFDDVMC